MLNKNTSHEMFIKQDKIAIVIKIKCTPVGRDELQIRGRDLIIEWEMRGSPETHIKQYGSSTAAFSPITYCKSPLFLI